MSTTTQSAWHKAHSYYARCVDEYHTFVESPHTQFNQDQQLMFGFTVGLFGVFIVLFGAQSVLSFSAASPIGLIVVLVGLMVCKMSREFIHSAF